MMFPIYLEGERIFSNSKIAIDTQDRKKLGEIKDGKVIYNPFEAFYLLENKKAKLIKNDKELKEQEILKIFSKNKDFITKYLVFKDLKNKGYVIKAGIKFGEEFRVYNKEDYKKNKHAKWICYPIKSIDNIKIKEFIAKLRVSHASGKKLLLAIVDSEEDIIYYEIDWIKP
ncbi:MAG: tRNA-intron lyase [Candidatus Pacearchaeota archaeon]